MERIGASEQGEATDGSQCPAVTGDLPTVEDACCKVDRVAVAYGLEGINAELRRRRENGNATLHELTEYLNARLTAIALSVGDVTIDAEPGTVYAALQNSDEIDIARRDEIRERVASGFDIERLRTDYVSHETIRKHLKDHLDVSTSQNSIDSAQDLEEALTTYKQQYQDAVGSALQRAAKQGYISGEEFRVFSTRLECQGCSSTYRLNELLADGGCDCSE